MKRELKPEEHVKILEHAQCIGVLANVIDVELRDILFDAYLGDPNLRNHVRRIKESTEQLKKGLAFKFKVKNREEMEEGMNLEIHRLMKYFSVMHVTQLSAFNDLCESKPIIDVEELANSI